MRILHTMWCARWATVYRGVELLTNVLEADESTNTVKIRRQLDGAPLIYTGESVHIVFHKGAPFRRVGEELIMK